MPSRGDIQGLRPFHGPNLLLFLLSLPVPVLSFVWALYRDSSNGYALSLLLDDFCPQSQGKIFY